MSTVDFRFGDQAAIDTVEDALGPVTLGADAAGIASAAPAEEMPLELWQREIDIDLTGVFLSSQAEAQAMIRNGGGAIVNIATMSARIANRGLHQAHYIAAKAGVVQLGRSLAWESALRGIRVNSVSPGYTYTSMTHRPEQIEAMEGYAANIPMGPERPAGGHCRPRRVSVQLGGGVRDGPRSAGRRWSRDLVSWMPERFTTSRIVRPGLVVGIEHPSSTPMPAIQLFGRLEAHDDSHLR